MQTWAVQDAKARFSEFLDTCLQKGPQVVTRRGVEAAVLVPLDLWKQMAEKQQAFEATSLSDVAGSLPYAGKGKSLEDMDRAIAEGAKRYRDASA